MSKKKVLIWTIVGVVAVVLIILSSTISTLKENTLSKKIEITKKINAGIAYEWRYEIEDSSIIECSEIYVLNDENTNGKVGAPVYRNYVFRGLKKGTTKVIFRKVLCHNLYLLFLLCADCNIVS